MVLHGYPYISAYREGLSPEELLVLRGTKSNGSFVDKERSLGPMSVLWSWQSGWGGSRKAMRHKEDWMDFEVVELPCWLARMTCSIGIALLWIYPQHRSIPTGLRNRIGCERRPGLLKTVGLQGDFGCTHYHCNLECRYCLTASSLSRCEDSPKSNGGGCSAGERIGFTSVELWWWRTFLQPWLPEALSEIATLLPVIVLTNGTLLTRSSIQRRLLKSKGLPVQIQISVDDPSPIFMMLSVERGAFDVPFKGSMDG